MNFRQVTTIALMAIFVSTLLGCSFQGEQPDQTIDPVNSKAFFVNDVIPAYPESSTTLLIYPEIIGDRFETDIAIAIECEHAVTDGLVQDYGTGYFGVKIYSDGKPWFGPCNVLVNGHSLPNRPYLQTEGLCVSDRPKPVEKPEYFEIAMHYSPVIYQDVGRWPEADLIAPFNYDGNWKGNDNWENIDIVEKEAVVYYSAVESETHIFVTYFVFHPIRYGTFVENATESHENSMTGMMIVLEKLVNGYEFILMETYVNGQFLIYSDNAKISAKHEKIRRSIHFEENVHPAVYIGAGRHGMTVDAPFVFGEYTGESGSDFPGGDGIVYRYKGQAQIPEHYNDRDVGYALLPVTETFWSRRNMIGNGQMYDESYMFSSDCSLPGKFDGNTFRDDAASPPWSWDDIDDGRVRKGEWFLFPAQTVSKHLSVSGPFSHFYTYHPYIGIE